MSAALVRVGALLVLLLLLLAGGCAPWSRGVVGPSVVSQVTLFTDQGSSQIDYRRGSGVQTLTPALAQSDFGIDATWAVVDYRRAHDDAAGTDLVTDLREVSSLDATFEHLMAEEDLFLAAHDAEARAALALPPAALDVTADGVMHPGDLQRRAIVSSVGYEDGALRVHFESALVVTAWRTPCGGTEMPQREEILDGVLWRRTYRIDARGELQGAVESRGPTRWPSTECDPRLASVPSSGAHWIVIGGVNAT